MKTPSKREIRDQLTASPATPAPPELLERIKAEIPERLEREARQRADGEPATESSAQGSWLLAASILVMLGGAALLTFRLAPDLVESELEAPSTTPGNEADADRLVVAPETLPSQRVERRERPSQPPPRAPGASLAEPEGLSREAPAGDSLSAPASPGHEWQRRAAPGASVDEGRSLELWSDAASRQARAMPRDRSQSFADRAAPTALLPSFRPGGPAALPAPMPDVSPRESFDAMYFDAPVPSGLTDTAEDPLSTFGLDVDTGSYTLIRRYLAAGRLPPPEAVRVEEMVNFFDYGDAPPRRGDFALHLEASPVRAPRPPVTHLLRIGVRARAIDLEERKPASLVFLVDVSGSMARGDRLELVKQALELLLEQLRRDDSVGLVVYESRPRVVLEPTSDKTLIREALRRLHPGGSTNLEGGLGLAYEMASRAARPGAINRVILCSDGVANVGIVDPEALLRSVADEAARGIELTTVGFGMGNYNDALMERLADRGDGSYAYVDSLKEAHRIFVESLAGTLETVAGDARIQVRFDPAAVASYRLLGYQNRALPDHVFRDPDVDAGEVGAGHRVTALYELVLSGEGSRTRRLSRDDVLAEVTLRYRSRATGEFEEVSARLHQRDLAPSWSGASAGLRLASLVADFAEALAAAARAEPGLDTVFRAAQPLVGEFPGRSDVAELVALLGEARDLLARQRR